MTQKNSCSAISSSVNEQLFGTAPFVEHWFLIEYDGNWGHDALESSKIPRMVKDYLLNELSNIKNSRIQLIKREGISEKGPLFYYANSTEFQPTLYKFQLGEYVDILDIDLASLAHNEKLKENTTDERIALVCAHGTHDQCCGTYGIPVYNELRDFGELSVWRTTHVGGHRFSANVVMLPEGIYYGRVNKSNINELLQHHKNNEIFLECYRGRTCYSQAAQISEYFLREKTGKNGIYDIRREYERDREYNISVEFCYEDSDLGYSVNSVVLYDSVIIPTSCGDSAKKSIPQFYFYSLFPYTPSKRKKVTER